MNLTIRPYPLSGEIAAIPSKSDVHRLLICAALADGPTELLLPSSSADIDATIRCLTALGASVSREDLLLRITPCPGNAKSPRLDCGESGSTLRFLIPIASLLADSPTFAGEGRLPSRPLAEYAACLEKRGLHFSQGHLPFQLFGRPASGIYSLPGNVSSQYISGLLFALPLLEGDSKILLTTPLESGGYVEMTLRTLRRFGVRIAADKTGWSVPGGQEYHTPGVLDPEGDWSNAAFFLTAGALLRPVTLRGLSLDSPQGDRRILESLQQFGAQIEADAEWITVSPAPLHGTTIDVAEIPDLLPVLSVAAAAAEGDTLFSHAARLRMKESDRIASTAAMLRSLGGNVEEGEDFLLVHGGVPLSGGPVNCQNDHRIVMAAAIAANLCSGETTLLGAEAVQKSYPGFFRDFQKIGGVIDVL